MSIHAKGEWQTALFESQKSWDINYSSILTELIHYAGRYTESYASDLFIIWKFCVDKKLYDPDLESFSILFGFRDLGVDHDIVGDEERIVVARHMKENSYYYRKVARLDVMINGDKIEMELKNVN